MASKLVHYRFDAETREKIRRAARVRCVTMTEFVRLAVNELAKRLGVA